MIRLVFTPKKKDEVQNNNVNAVPSNITDSQSGYVQKPDYVIYKQLEKINQERQETSSQGIGNITFPPITGTSTHPTSATRVLPPIQPPQQDRTTNNIITQSSSNNRQNPLASILSHVTTYISNTPVLQNTPIGVIARAVSNVLSATQQSRQQKQTTQQSQSVSTTNTVVNNQTTSANNVTSQAINILLNQTRQNIQQNTSTGQKVGETDTTKRDSKDMQNKFVFEIPVAGGTIRLPPGIEFEYEKTERRKVDEFVDMLGNRQSVEKEERFTIRADTISLGGRDSISGHLVGRNSDGSLVKIPVTVRRTGDNKVLLEIDMDKYNDSIKLPFTIVRDDGVHTNFVSLDELRKGPLKVKTWVLDTDRKIDVKIPTIVKMENGKVVVDIDRTASGTVIGQTTRTVELPDGTKVELPFRLVLDGDKIKYVPVDGEYDILKTRTNEYIVGRNIKTTRSVDIVVKDGVVYYRGQQIPVSTYEQINIRREIDLRDIIPYDIVQAVAERLRSTLAG